MESELRLLKSTFDNIGENDALLSIVGALDRAKLSILDVGCGDGATLRKLCHFVADRGAVVNGVGVDPAAPALESSSNVRLHAVRFEDFETHDAFDVIICKQALYYLGSPIPAVHRMLSLLAPKGMLCIVLWSKRCSLYSMSRALDEAGIATLTIEELVALIKDEIPHVHVSTQTFNGSVDFSKWINNHDIMRSAAKVLVRTSTRPIDEGAIGTVARLLTSADRRAPRINGLITVWKANE